MANIRYPDRVCVICGATFTPSNSRAKACPGKCRIDLNNRNCAERYRRGKEKVCLVCFVTFTPEHGSAKVCSEPCRIERIRQANVEHGKSRIRGNDGVVEGQNRLDVPMPEWLNGIPDDIDAPVVFEPNEFSEGQVRAYYGLDQKDPKPYRTKSLAECEALKGKTG